MQTLTKEKPRDNDRLKFKPEYHNAEADFWKMKYIEAVIALQNANRGIARLVKRKQMWSDTARACRRVRDKSLIEGYERGVAAERNLLNVSVKHKETVDDCLIRKS